MRLFLKIFITFLVILTLSLSIYSSIIINLEKRDLEENLNLKIEFNKKLYSEVASVLLFNFNEDTLKSFISSIFNDKEVIKIKLIDYSNILNIELEKKTYKKEFLVKSEIPLVFEKEKIGLIQIHYTSKYINQLLNNFKIYILLFTIILSLICLVTIYILSKRLTNSLTILSTAAEKISLGDLSVVIESKGNDEISLLAKKFEQMRGSLIEREKTNEEQSKEIKALNENLQEKIKERTKELEDSNSILQESLQTLEKTQDKLIESEKMAGLGSLVAGVAHEINTPVGIGLTGITHFEEELKRLKKLYSEENMTQDDFELFLKETNELTELIKKNLDRTANLVKSFKRVAVDQTSHEAREINLKDYIHESVASLGKISKTSTININCPKDIVIKTYPGAISQIITNLIINSSIHGFEDKDKGEIVINIEQITKDDFLIDYKDDGKGIKEENIKKIFDPFFTTNRQKGGSGLGLNIIYNIVKNTLNGSIKCESVENEGVNFIITFKTIEE